MIAKLENLVNGELFDQADAKKLNSSQINDNYDCTDDDKVLGTELLASQKNWSSAHRIEEPFVKLLPTRKVFAELVFRELRTKYPSIVISISTIVLLLLFLALINVAMGVSPLIYLMISEREHTETDVVFYNPEITFLNKEDANEQISQFLIDYKTIKEQFCDSYLQGCASRFSAKAQVAIDAVEYQTNFMLIDIAAEQHANLGRRIALDPLHVNGECYVSEEIYKFLSKEQKKVTDGKYELILEITLELLLAQVPGLQSEMASRSTDIKAHFIANQLFNYFNSQGIDYSTSDELLAEILKGSQLPENISKLLIHNFSLDKLLHTPSVVHGESKQTQKYKVCLSISSFILSLKANLNLSTAKSITQGSGKFADNMARLVVMDYVTQREWLLEQISAGVIDDILEKMKDDSLSLYFSLQLQKKDLQQRLFKALNTFASKEFFEEKAMVVLGVFKDKASVYMSEDSIIKEVKATSSGYSDLFGVIFPTRITFPLAIAQTNKLRQKVILDSSYNAGVFLLVMLSSVIIYSVSEASISQQIQEYGIVRIVGSSVRSLLLYTLLKTAIFFILPSLILSSTLNEFVLQMLNSYFYNLLQLQQSSHFEASFSFMLTTLFIGIVLPLVCNLMPFKTFLDKQVLSSALHAHSRVLNQTKVFVQKLEKYGVSPYALLNSVILVTIGILAYYFAPYAFVTKNMGLFLLIVNITFLMVNAGISLLMTLVQRWIELGFIKILLRTICIGDCNLSAAILNNFKNNKTRMKKVGMIIMMIFSFYISIGSNVNSQVQTIKNIVKLNIGSDYVLHTTSEDQSLDEIPLINQLEKYKELHPGVIKAYSFVSMKLSKIMYLPSTSRIKSYTGATQELDCVAVDSQFYDSIYNELFIPDSQQFQGQNPSNSLYYPNKTSIGRFNESETLSNKDSYLVQSNFSNNQFISYPQLTLHSNEQAIQLYISTKEKKSLQLDYGNYMNIYLGYERFRGQPAGFASKLPGFTSFTQNELISLISPESLILISAEQFEQIVHVNYISFGFSETTLESVLRNYPNSTNNIPKTKLFVKLTEDFKVTNSQRHSLKSVLLQEGEQQGKNSRERPLIELQDTHMIFASLQYLVQFWDVVFHLISVFIFILSYYLLTITFKSNVEENMHNIKIYKALGITHRQIQKIFIYEGLSVMLVNGILGVLVGLLLSVMIQQQIVIFLEIAQDLSTVPYEITLFLLAMCVFLSIFISKREVDQIKHYAISEIGK